MAFRLISVSRSYLCLCRSVVGRPIIGPIVGTTRAGPFGTLVGFIESLGRWLDLIAAFGR